MGCAVSDQAQYDVIDRAVMSLAADKSSSTDEEESATSNGVHGDEFDVVSASEWPGLPSEVVLLQPQQCRQIWRQFSTESHFPVQQALDMQVKRAYLLSTAFGKHDVSNMKYSQGRSNSKRDP